MEFNNAAAGKPIYTKKLTEDGHEKRHYIHLHLDLHECDHEVVQQFLDIGFEADDFHPNSGVFGYKGDPDKRFPVSAPRAHFTYKPYEINEDGATNFGTIIENLVAMECMAQHLIDACGVKGYTETELIILDRQFPDKAFDPDAFGHYFYNKKQKNIESIFTESVFYTDLKYSEKLELPMRPVMRSLGTKDGKDEAFRVGELHLVLQKQGTDPPLLTALAAMSPSSPSIFKRIQHADGSYRKDSLGNDDIIEDVAFTFQSDDMRSVYKMAAALQKILEDVGGYKGASLKIEPVIGYSLHNGISYEDQYGDLPMIIDKIHVRETCDLKHIFQDECKYAEDFFDIITGFSGRRLQETRDAYQRHINHVLAQKSDVISEMQSFHRYRSTEMKGAQNESLELGG